MSKARRKNKRLYSETTLGQDAIGGNSCASSSSSSNVPPPEKLVLSETGSLIRDFSALVNNVDNHDVAFLVGNKPCIMYGHKLILTARSEYFRTLFASEWKESDGVIRKPNMSPSVFGSILQYIYTEQLIAPTKHLVEIIEAAEEFRMVDLKEKCGERLTKLVSTANAFSYLDLAMKYLVRSLQDFCVKYICEHAHRMLTLTDDARELSGEMVGLVLGQEELKLKEIDVWRFLLRWGLFQLKMDTHELYDFTEDERKALLAVIQPFFVHIRWFRMSLKDFVDVENSKLLSAELHCEFFRYHHFPTAPVYKSDIRARPRSFECLEAVDTILLTREHLEKILLFIDKPSVAGRFELLFRASRDGFSASTFHAKCDNKGATVTVLRTTGNKLLGCYCGCPWNANATKAYTHADSFTFELRPECRILHRTQFAEQRRLLGPMVGIVESEKKNDKLVTETRFALRIADNCDQNCDSGAGAGEMFMVADYEVLAVLPPHNAP